MSEDIPVVLKELRTRQNLKQREVAKVANISERAYSFYENGQREPNVDTLLTLAEFYNIPMDILVGRYKMKQ